MGSINIGFTDNRNSSRILKPPGGDTSDIFGVRELKKAEDVKLKSKADAEEVKVNGNAKNEEDVKNSEKVAQPESQKPTEAAKNEKVEEKIDSIEEKENKIENVEIGNVEKNTNDKADTSNDEKKSENAEKEKMDNKNTEKSPETIKDILTEKPQTNGTAATNEESKINGAVKRTKNRIPPGGYSSGLW